MQNKIKGLLVSTFAAANLSACAIEVRDRSDYGYYGGGSYGSYYDIACDDGRFVSLNADFCDAAAFSLASPTGREVYCESGGYPVTGPGEFPSPWCWVY